MDRDEALRSLEMVAGGERRARRHGVNNGVIPLVWGLVVLVGLPLYDLLPGAIAGMLFSVAVGLGATWTALYASRLRVRVDRAGRWEYTRVIVGGMIVYAIVLIGGQLLLRGRADYPMLLIAPFAAAPLLIAGLLRVWRGRATAVGH